MSERIDIGSSSEITNEACAWVAQIESGDLSGSDIAALQEWMGRSPQHAREIKEIAALSGQLSILTEMAEPLAKAAALDNELRKPRWRSALGAPAFAAAGGLAAIFALIVSIFVLSPTPQSPVHYRTAVGEIQTIELADGSIIKLNTDSEIEVDFRQRTRSVRLISGEALFDVASNPDRPFIVYSGETVSEAVGTSFVVRLRDRITELAVVEGKVAFSILSKTVSAPAQPSSIATSMPEPLTTSGVIVGAGQTLTSETIPIEAAGNPNPDLPTIETREIQRKLSWTEGLFDFSETPLDEVVAEISRHNNVTIEIVDADLRALKFGGMFRTGDVDQLLEALEGLGIAVEHAGDDRILLRKAENT